MYKFNLIIATSVSLALFLGGITTLALHIEFWSYYFGIPATQMGIIFLILIFDKVSHITINEDLQEQRKRWQHRANPSSLSL
ncbi:MAG: hypothetical protein HYT11_02290 [Candidatus Levybacteria bacterium]|nr:hypothetical protein [Candidatus Levybacteria bacterium]